MVLYKVDYAAILYTKENIEYLPIENLVWSEMSLDDIHLF